MINQRLSANDVALYLWYATLAALAAYVLLWWQFWTDLPSHGEMFTSYASILNGTYDAPFQYRYVAYLLPELIRRVTGFSLQTSEAINRTFWLWGCALALHAYFRNWFTRHGAIIGVLGFFGSVPLFVVQTSFAPSDIPALFFLIIGLHALYKHRYYQLLWILPLGLLFRETTIYFFSVWGIIFLFEKDRRIQLPYLLGTLFLSTVVYLGLRFYFGFQISNTFTLSQNFKDTRTLVRPLLLFGVFWLVIWFNLKTTPKFLKYTLVLIPIVVLANMLYGYAKDSRLWFPLVPVLLPIGLRYILNEEVETSASPQIA